MNQYIYLLIGVVIGFLVSQLIEVQKTVFKQKAYDKYIDWLKNIDADKIVEMTIKGEDEESD